MKNCCAKNKNLVSILLSVLIFLLLALLIWNYQQKNNLLAPEENNSEIINEINDENKLTLTEQEFISSYLENNISELSPEKEVLGGNFYVTSIDFLSDQKLIIEYEDGHISLKAEIDFEYLDSENIIIKNFEIIN